MPVIISPNMSLPVPVVSQEPGPQWAADINASLSILDGHNHSPGSGVQITPAGLNINTDLPINSNNLTLARSVRFSPQLSPLSLGSDIGCLYESGVDLYYNDGAGNQVRITQSGAVTGATGTITGLPSGTASASYSAGTFTFQSATSTPANLAVGPISIGLNIANSKTVTISSTAGQASNYSLFLPAAAPATNQIMVSDNSGNLTWQYGLIPLGSVLATFPNLSGAYTTSATTVADAQGFVLCAGQTIADASSPMNTAVIPNINNSVFLQGSSSAGGTGGSNSTTLTTTQLPAHTHGAGSYSTSVGVTGGTASLTGTTSFASTSHTHNMAHDHQWIFVDSNTNSYVQTTSSASQGTWTNSAATLYQGAYQTITTGAAASPAYYFNASLGQSMYTSGALNPPGGSVGSATTGTPSATASVGISSTAASLTGSNSVTGTSSSAGSGTAYDSRPSYINAVFVMRVK